MEETTGIVHDGEPFEPETKIAELRARFKKDYTLEELKSDENLWHEKQISKKKVVRQKMDELVQSFTIHGLTRVCTAQKFEALFWLVMLLLGLTCCGYIIHNLVDRYTKREIYSQISSKLISKNPFPSVTICEFDLLVKNYFQYCHLQKDKNTSQPCFNREHHHLEDPVEVSSNMYWNNGFFNVTRCQRMDGLYCIDTASLRSREEYGHSCITWNYNGDVFDIYGHVEISFTFNNSKLKKPEEATIIAMIHDPLVVELDVTKKVEIEPFKTYDITIDKTIIKRLPAPFPSNCTAQKNPDIFPGKYGRRSCIESLNFIELYKKCGDVFDYVRRFVPEDIKKNYTRYDSIETTMNCMISGKGRVEDKDCQFPCEEMDLAILSTFSERHKRADGNKSVYRINLQYQRVDSVRVLEEKEMYTWSQMLCEIGGFVGLVIGASVISVVELSTYITLMIINKWFL